MNCLPVTSLVGWIPKQSKSRERTNASLRKAIFTLGGPDLFSREIWCLDLKHEMARWLAMRIGTVCAERFTYRNLDSYIWAVRLKPAIRKPMPREAIRKKGCAKQPPEDLGDEILHFYPHPPAWKTRWFFGGKFSCIFSQGKMALKFVTPKTSENFTTFSTARNEICHLELALGATSRNKGVQLGNARAIRAYQAIHANLRIDSRQIGPSKLRTSLRSSESLSVAILKSLVSGRRGVFVSRLFSRGFGHYSATIARLNPLSGLERGGWELLPVRGCEIGRDRAFQSRSLLQRGSYSGRGAEAEIV